MASLGACKRIGALADAVREAERDSDVWVPLLPIRHFWHCQAPDTLVQNLQEDLDRIWANGGYQSLKVVGHSMGGILARGLLFRGRQVIREQASADTGSGQDHWAYPDRDRDRLILLAPVNRGIGISRHMRPVRVIQAIAGLAYGSLMSLFFLQPTFLSVLRGSRFLTRMRLDWLEEHLDRPMPLTVQLLGSVDDLVAPEDNIDSATGCDFFLSGRSAHWAQKHHRCRF